MVKEDKKTLLFILITLIGLCFFFDIDFKSPEGKTDILIYFGYSIPIFLGLYFLSKKLSKKSFMFQICLFLGLIIWSVITFFLLKDILILITMIISISVIISASLLYHLKFTKNT
ncbi:hypothetical protein E8M24_32310 [Bacillus thuringiensis]|uniref:hypothetical protein n=1 Tax=Bacillus cereus group TaxID=86661 RepID=UPI0011EC9097|nr:MULTISPECIES: hypothetical protein [Bacillus cereus group]KAA0797550.1 hypothetical protein DN406_09655 [Bacillus sp. BB56-3]KAB5624764.1 hypothetical protein E8M24_32310 [Bacillus thuringiensis]